MRELKFRVWNGMEMIYDVTVGKFGTFYVNPSNNGLDEKDSASLTPFNTKYSNTIPVMQFTGLKDKNGKEIYEGDLFENFTSGISGIVEWSNELALFQTVQYIDGQEFTATIYSHQEGDFKNTNRKVVGNIYENPELFESLKPITPKK
jgi:uncharacterized phage protein (TIGR01671 family)